ncbi:MAG: hypothetical protein K2G86_07725, partial [Prevotella sp.]|nr:hypothetical protein [Prevotella sp.]
KQTLQLTDNKRIIDIANISSQISLISLHAHACDIFAHGRIFSESLHSQEPKNRKKEDKAPPHLQTAFLRAAPY